MSPHNCPKCGSPLKQVHRRFIDRLISQFYRVHRYRCLNSECRWEGILHSRRHKTQEKQVKWWLWALVVLVGIAIGLILVERLSTPSSTSTDVTAAP
jgi:hypothetical protein